MHPLDLIKTRLQIQRNRVAAPNDPKYYHGIWDCFRKMYRYEGLTSFWKGILPPIVAETPKRAVKVEKKIFFSLSLIIFFLTHILLNKDYF